MPTTPLTDEAKDLAREIYARISANRMKRELQYIIDRTDLMPYNETAKENSDLSSVSNGPMSYSELSELVSAGLVHENFLSGSLFSFRILKTLDHAVAQNFGEQSELSRPNIGNGKLQAEPEVYSQVKSYEPITIKVETTLKQEAKQFKLLSWRSAIGFLLLIIAFLKFIVADIVVPLYSSHMENPDYIATNFPQFSPTADVTNASLASIPAPSETAPPSIISIGTFAATVDVTMTLQARAFNDVLHNSDWTVIERIDNGFVMVLVPTGCFMMGTDVGFPSEGPAHEACQSKPFWIDKFEVTQIQYHTLGGEKTYQNRSTGNEFPIQHTTWYEAATFCERRGGRLPTEMEWEYAARGPESWKYPWGNEFIAEYVIYGENIDFKPAAVGSRNNKSWVGAFDFIGNVWEWTSSTYTQNYDQWDNSTYEPVTIESASDDLEMVIRGAGSESATNEQTTTRRIWYNPTNAPNAGIRCVQEF